MQRIALMTRRHLLAGMATTLAGLPARAQDQADRAEMQGEFRVLRARRVDAGAAGPGPVLRVGRGQEVKIRLINELSEDTALHWHGVRVPNGMDGVPRLTQAPVAPGASFDYVFRAPDAGTFWYHLHPRWQAAAFHGALVVEESEPAAVDRDVVFVLAATGDSVSVNGQASRDVAVTANERIRLRLVNAAYRAMALRLDPHRATVMAIDGQPAEPFAARDGRVGLGPGNRIDLFVDMTLAPGAEAPLMLRTEQDEIAIARFRYGTGEPRRKTPLPDPKPLPATALPQRIPLQNAQRMEVPIERGARAWTDAKAAFGPPLFSVKRGRTVVLGFKNSGEPMVLHLHGHAVRLLDNLDDGWKPFWLDTFVVAQQPMRIAFVADNPGKWLISARPLRPDDAGLATWFEVT